jgi:hypothetical protein
MVTGPGQRLHCAVALRDDQRTMQLAHDCAGYPGHQPGVTDVKRMNLRPGGPALTLVRSRHGSGGAWRRYLPAFAAAGLACDALGDANAWELIGKWLMFKWSVENPLPESEAFERVSKGDLIMGLFNRVAGQGTDGSPLPPSAEERARRQALEASMAAFGQPGAATTTTTTSSSSSSSSRGGTSGGIGGGGVASRGRGGGAAAEFKAALAGDGPAIAAQLAADINMAASGNGRPAAVEAAVRRQVRVRAVAGRATHEGLCMCMCMW